MNEIRYFDIHSHLNFAQFDDDRDALIAEMREKGIATITVGTGLETSREAVALAEAHEHIWATVGIHPGDASDETFDRVELAKLADHPKVVAIGECGLDYYRGSENAKKQKEVFKAHIDLAISKDLPLMIHGRPSPGTMDAYEGILEILTTHNLQPTTRGNVHFFVGNVEIAQRFLDIGFTLSFDGPVTFSRDYDETIRSIPLDMLMAETDAPFAAPAPHRGKRNSPLYVEHVVAALASIRGEDVEAVRKASVENARRVFGIKTA